MEKFEVKYYCSQCKSRIHENDLFCVNCGNETNETGRYTKRISLKKKKSLKRAKACSILSIVFGIIGIVPILNIVFLPASIILAIIGWIKGKRSKNRKTKRIKVLSLVIVVISILTSIVWVSLAINGFVDSIDYPQNIIETSKEDIVKKDVRITTTAKTNIPKDTSQGRYSDRVEFTFKIENLTVRSIKGIQGTLIIYDLFNNKIISLGCDFTGKTIPGYNSIIINDIGLDINQFMDTHTKLYNEKFSDLKFEYEVNEIIYTDNIQSETSNNLNTYSAKVEVLNKYNLDKNYDAGRYSARVEFKFKITNKSPKTIKGVQGTLIVKDLFGEDFISINCDFTGNTISPYNYITVSDLGIDINQFMDNHVKLYNEKYDDLNFDYIIKSIVYTDGTTENYE